MSRVNSRRSRGEAPLLAAAAAAALAAALQVALHVALVALVVVVVVVAPPAAAAAAAAAAAPQLERFERRLRGLDELGGLEVAGLAAGGLAAHRGVVWSQTDIHTVVTQLHHLFALLLETRI